jgi:hypothetical protein
LTVPASVSLAGSLVLASAFLLSSYCRRFTLEIARRWQSLSAGVAVAYVLVNLLPELEEHRATVAGSALGALLDVQKRIYIWVLAGLLAFAGLSRLRSHSSHGTQAERVKLLFRGAIAGYSLYVLLIGFLLVRREDASLLSLGLYVFAIGLHLFMVDGEMAEQFEERYERRGRMLLAGSAPAGWALGMVGAFPDEFTSRLFAFLAGGVLVTSIHSEIRAEEGVRFLWFVAGSVVYAVVLMLV